jgi:hypothetical protein
MRHVRLLCETALAAYARMRARQVFFTSAVNWYRENYFGGCHIQRRRQVSGGYKMGQR